MPLSDDDKVRIREEEQYRQQVRHDLRRAAPHDARFITLTLVAIVVLLMLWNVANYAKVH